MLLCRGQGRGLSQGHVLPGVHGRPEAVNSSSGVRALCASPGTWVRPRLRQQQPPPGGGGKLPGSAKLGHALPEAGSVLLENRGPLQVQVEPVTSSQS